MECGEIRHSAYSEMVVLRENADAPKGLKVGDYSAVFGVSADSYY